MAIILGKKGIKYSWQNNFPEETKCCRPSCAGQARLGFVFFEGTNTKEYVANLYENDPDGKGFWLHDACAVAVYFCKQCLKPTALYNQA